MTGQLIRALRDILIGTLICYGIICVIVILAI